MIWFKIEEINHIFRLTENRIQNPVFPGPPSPVGSKASILSVAKRQSVFRPLTANKALDTEQNLALLEKTN